MLIHVDSTDDNERYTDWYLSSSDPPSLRWRRCSRRRATPSLKAALLWPGSDTDRQHSGWQRHRHRRCRCSAPTKCGCSRTACSWSIARTKKPVSDLPLS